MSVDRPDRPADTSPGIAVPPPPTGRPAAEDATSRPAADEVPPADEARVPRRRKPRKQTSLLRELPILLVVAFVLALLVKTFLVQAFFIPSGSMERTLHGCPGCTGDRVLVNKVPYWFGQPEPGDIVVFEGPDTWSPEVQIAEPDNWVSGALLAIGRTLGVAPPSEDDYVKRVIAVGGQTVECCDQNGRVMVDGTPLDEPYIFEDTPVQTRPFTAVTVPEGRLWVMGDHRSASADSRSHVDDKYSGTIAVDDVIGKAAVIVWPFDRFTFLDSPDIQGQDPPSAAAVPDTGSWAAGALVAGPLTVAGRRRSRRTQLSGPSRRPPGTGWRRMRRVPRTRPARDPSER